MEFSEVHCTKINCQKIFTKKIFWSLISDLMWKVLFSWISYISNDQLIEVFIPHSPSFKTIPPYWTKSVALQISNITLQYTVQSILHIYCIILSSIRESLSENNWCICILLSNHTLKTAFLYTNSTQCWVDRTPYTVFQNIFVNIFRFNYCSSFVKVWCLSGWRGFEPVSQSCAQFTLN